jgi:hypothetical protein
MIHEVRAEAGGQDALRQSHAHRVAKALAERTGRDLDTRSVSELRMSGGLRVELSKLPDLVHRELVPGQVEQGVEQHGAVSSREDEAVAVGPARRPRVVTQKLSEQHGAYLGAAQRETHVPDSRASHGIYGEDADRLRDELYGLGRKSNHQSSPLEGRAATCACTRALIIPTRERSARPRQKSGGLGRFTDEAGGSIFRPR